MFRDPRVFQIVMCVLYVAQMARWVTEKRWPQVAYWLGALIINGSVWWMSKV